MAYFARGEGGSGMGGSKHHDHFSEAETTIQIQKSTGPSGHIHAWVERACPIGAKWGERFKRESDHAVHTM